MKLLKKFMDIRSNTDNPFKHWILQKADTSWDRSSFVCCLVRRGSTDDLLFASDFHWCCLADQGSLSVTQQD